MFDGRGEAAAIDVEWAFRRYEAVRPRLPATDFPRKSLMVRTLSDVADRYDAFVLDAFGVLNVGEVAIPGAVERMAELRKRGKRLLVLTNAASYPRAAAAAKYRAIGFDFAPEEIISSRDLAALHIAALAPGAVWGALAAAGDSFADIPAEIVDLVEFPDAFETADGFLLLSSARWTAAFGARLAASLEKRPRRLVVANPDLVAPRESGLSLEPGMIAHDLADRLGIIPRYFGKPFANAFAEVRKRLGDLPPERIAMVGDTLHTDVLGGRSAGMGTVLVTSHGLFAGRDVIPYVVDSGIRPDVIAQTT